MCPNRWAETHFDIKSKANNNRADEKNDKRDRTIAAVLLGEIDFAMAALISDI